VNRRPLIRAIDPDGGKGSFAADVKILNSKPRRRVLCLDAMLKPRRLSLAVDRPGWYSFSVSVLLHVAFVGALVIWAPVHVARVIETYVVEIVTAPPQLAFSRQQPAVSPKKEEPPKPPETKKEIPPPKPEPVAVAAKPPPPTPLPRITPPAPSAPAPLRMATAAPTPQPAAVAASTHTTTSNTTTAAAASGGEVEDVADPVYVNSIREAVAHQLRYPELALRRGIEGRVVLRLTLTTSGHLLKATPGEPAADVALTNAALTAVRRAAPFPPWHGTRNPNALLSLILPIRFTLDEKGEKR
jgi:TonB family protein